MSTSIMESCIFSGRKREARLARIDAKYSVDDRGVVWSSGMPLAAICGIGVNLHGKRVKVAYLVITGRRTWSGAMRRRSEGGGGSLACAGARR